jgi:hypothetical protein
MNERRLKFYRYGGRPAGLVAFRLVILSSIASLLVLLAMIGSASGQDQPQIQTAPPPLKVVPKAERESLEKENKPKDRTKLALELMDLRLTKAEAANTSDDLSLTFAELGIFHALMDNTLIFLDEVHRSTGKSLDNFKRFEIGLRRFTPRLEMLRREMPLTHEYYIRSLLRQLRDARTKATEPLFGDSVISNL